MKRLLALCCVLILPFAIACGGDDEPDISKSEAADMLEEDEIEYDPCEEYGWYDDGQCDEFCPEPDPDCDELDVGENQDDGSTNGSEDNQFDNGVQNSDTPTDPGASCSTDADCHIGGCSGQLCGHVDDELISTCEWLPEYACYDDDYTSCGCNDGTCGWAQTDDLAQCLDEAGDGPIVNDGTKEPGDNDEQNDGQNDEANGEACPMVIVYGTDPETGECQQFPTPCDVPEGWEIDYEGCDDLTDPAHSCETNSECVTGGCSGTLCRHVDADDVATTCEWLPEYACYDEAYTTCGCFEGSCGWDDTEEFAQCLEDKG